MLLWIFISDMLKTEKTEGDIDAIKKAKVVFASCMDSGKVS